MVSPHWRAVAANRHTRPRFLKEVAKLLNQPAFEPNLKDPLSEWIRNLATHTSSSGSPEMTEIPAMG
ncbi:hypothetical protein GCM10012278_70080 [Nonomuraea glycinis]|uniref:Uncharacterized protein n=1 Tax=Nonomuraea glycinis TaxID=2047744 RepID=A0A918E9M0_9ACTN|nr:hypothetical protein GCM10012278_70080 [Nonomuraea glycinis]